ncbi:hypothetical protein [Methylobacterium sp. Leaf118]|uniref:hypothetical protein n=1 Tax=Methylobacterium sp. Leaf118 TaxID=2876562 RepID=UPI001E3B159D|nr:hypothetical protein [Methylobacterium sp. Leaf118]
MKLILPRGYADEGADRRVQQPSRTITEASSIITPGSHNYSEDFRNILDDYYGLGELRREPKWGPRTDVDRGFADFIQDRQHSGWQGLFGTALFNQLSGGPRARNQQMCRRIMEFHEKVCHHILRYPNKPKNREWRPILLGVPETAWRGVLREIGLAPTRPNDGEHWHFVLLTPPPRVSRLPDGFLAHFEAEKHRLYICPGDGRRDILRDIHFRPMDRSWGTVWGYMTKEGGRNRRFADDLLVL